MGSSDDNFSLTGYEPNDYLSTETYVEFNQESVTEQRFPEDLDYDDTVIGQTLFNAYRRRASHSQDEGLSSSQSSSVSHDRTGRPVVKPVDSHIPNVRENPCRDSENEQIRILLERQKEQILADCQAELQKHEFQADYELRTRRPVVWSVVVVSES